MSNRVCLQIYEDQFLVEFLPCKHGEFRKASYQETFVYDIISLDDAHRHSILPGDKVLAPWEPESSRYGPGVVVEGQEKRLAEGLKTLLSSCACVRACVRVCWCACVSAPVCIHIQIVIVRKTFEIGPFSDFRVGF